MRLFRSKRPRTLFFFHETSWSGAPIQLLHLVTWLKSKGWDVAAAVPRESTSESGPISACLTKLGVEVFPVLDLSALPDFPNLRELCQRFDVIVANTLTMWAAVRAAHDTGTPSVWYIHESLVARQLIEQLVEIQSTLPLAQLLVMPTQRTARIYDAYVDRPIEVVPYGIPALPLRPARSASDHLTFLLLGTYEPRKGQDLFLEAISQLSRALSENSRFQMAGRKLSPDFFAQLERRAVDLPSVKLGDALEHKEAGEAIAAADVLVCASRDETMPVAILEAMSLGKVIVTTDVGGISEWLRDGINALVVRSEDPTALSEALQCCLTDPALRARLGKGAQRTFAKDFSIDRLGKTFSGLIKAAAQTGRQ